MITASTPGERQFSADCRSTRDVFRPLPGLLMRTQASGLRLTPIVSSPSSLPLSPRDSLA